MKPETGTVAEYVQAFKQSSRFGPRIIDHRQFAAKEGTMVEPDQWLPSELNKLLARVGISGLYSHQQQAIELIFDKKNVLVATPTASGKSLIYNLPVFRELLENPQARALYLFPLKALAQDQLKTLDKFRELLPDHFAKSNRQTAAIYDGDTSGYMRKKIRDNLPAILISNPDMLHLSMLPYHHLWGTLFANLTHIVLDEVHTYRGVFGSHMAWVIRRLRRICALYGSDPVFILSSATIGNPEELGSGLLSAPVEVITDSGAPQPARNVILLNPLDSAATTATMLLESAIHRQLRTIVYTQSRKMTELITIWCEKRLKENKGRIAAYRAGFLPEDRRRIEQRLADGDLLGVISTSALELGIDIGGLDICLLVGYPGSMMATWQRAGRVGRDGRESLVVLIGHEDALDQHFMRNPDDFFKRSIEPVVLNPDNENIAARHLVCAAAENPLTTTDELLSQGKYTSLISSLELKGKLLLTADGTTWFSARKYPQRRINLRGAGDRFILYSAADRTVLGEIDGHRACTECHQGAIYLHMAKTWLVTSLDLEAREILVQPARPTYYTRAMVEKDTEILTTEQGVPCGATTLHFGRLRVTEQITGYHKILTGRQQVIARLPLDLPPQVFETKGLWLEIPLKLQKELEEKKIHFMGSIHALEHAIIGTMPLLILCDRNDIGGMSYPFHEQLKKSAIFVYDGYAGGIGLCEKAFFSARELLQQTMEIVTGCGCNLGCPSCVHSPKCGSGNRPIDKNGCMLLLERLLDSGRKPTALNRPQVKILEPVPVVRKKEIPRRYGVFDLETKRSAKEVGGWHRADRMGISMAVVYDGLDDTFYSYEEDEVPQLLEHLFRLELVVGFNNKRFDNKVLSAYTTKKLSSLPSLDILEEITGQLGYRLSLDRLAEHTLGVKKSGDGLQALQWYKQGEIEKIRTYCRKDVEITRDLFLHGFRQQHLLFQNKAKKIVRLPVDFSRTIQKRC
ncbi:MAG: DEAD/DEAH box helicase [Desulfobulbaceae bacterium]|nr:DEAD/DEAH box helicase [Desulfobulbaceae bacterium]